MNCKNHPEELAIFHCVQCKNAFCQPCVTSRKVDDTFTAYICKECSGKCEPISQTAPKPKAKPSFFPPLLKAAAPQAKPITARTASEEPVSFWKSISGVFIFPFKGPGFLFVLGATVIWYLLGEFGYFLKEGSLVLYLVFFTYFTVCLFKIAEDSLYGSLRLESLPGGNYWQGMAEPALYSALAVILYTLPAQVYFVYLSKFDFVYLAVLLAGFFLLPMAILRIIISHRLSLLNPIGVAGSALKLFIPYVSLLAVFFILGGLVLYANFEFLVDFGKPGAAAARLLFVYILIMEARLLGIFARAYEPAIARRKEKTL